MALALGVGLPVALTVALAFGLALAVAVMIAWAFALTVAVAVGFALAVRLALVMALTLVAVERGSLSRALVSSGMALLLLPLLQPVGMMLSLPMLVRRLLALLRDEALLRTGPDCVAMAEVCRQRSFRDDDHHERVLLRVGVVTDRHLGRWVLGGGGGDV